MASLYIHINKINNKKYVGISSYTDPSTRWGKNGSGYKGSLFYEAGIMPYGWNSFEHKILLSDIDLDTAQQLEARIIKELELCNLNYGYNESDGVKIKPNENLDNLINNLITKIKSPNIEDMDLFESSYQYKTTMYSLKMLLLIWNEKRINTDLDCQRGYTWNEERQQGLWDTLLFGHRIPEIHAIRAAGASLDVMDGKQRITTLMNILNNVVPLKKAFNSEKLNPLFKELGGSIYFKDLPEKLQTKLLNTEIPVAEYWDISDEDMVILFRKLNAGDPLDEFSKGIANHINLRTRFTRAFTSPQEHPTLQSFFSSSDIRNSEDEKFLLRLAIMLKTKLDCNCQPREMEQYYENFTTQELIEYQKTIYEYLNMINSCVNELSFGSKKSYFPIVSYIVITEKLNFDQTKQFFKSVNKQGYPGRGGDLSKREIKNRYNNLMAVLQEVKNNYGK